MELLGGDYEGGFGELVGGGEGFDVEVELAELLVFLVDCPFVGGRGGLDLEESEGFVVLFFDYCPDDLETHR